MEKAYGYFKSAVLNIVNTLLSLVKIVLSSNFRLRLPKARAESCAILGNGPSLTKSLKDHPDFFKGHDLMCVNSFSLSDQYVELKPKYYVFLDPAFWRSNADAIKNTFECIKEKTSWPLFLLIPAKAFRSAHLKQMKQNKNIKIVYYNYTVFKGFDKVAHWFYDQNLAMPQSQNVLVASVFLSINMGYKKVYLFGADHSWHQNLAVKEDNRTHIKHEVFYQDKLKEEYKPFYKTQDQTDSFRIDEVFELLRKTFSGYKALENYAKYKNCKIYNASEDSFIDAFERVKV